MHNLPSAGVSIAERLLQKPVKTLSGQEKMGGRRAKLCELWYAEC